MQPIAEISLIRIFNLADRSRFFCPFPPGKDPACSDTHGGKIDKTGWNRILNVI